jgi:acyl-coenzyme A synthetase/AMP-(fatty) acid ligase
VADDGELAAWQHALAARYAADLTQPHDLSGPDRPGLPLPIPADRARTATSVGWPDASSRGSARSRAVQVERRLADGWTTDLLRVARRCGVAPVDLILTAIDLLCRGRRDVSWTVVRVSAGAQVSDHVAGVSDGTPVESSLVMPLVSDADARFLDAAREVSSRRLHAGREGGAEDLPSDPFETARALELSVRDAGDHRFDLPPETGLGVVDLPVPRGRCPADRAVHLHLGAGLLIVEQATEGLEVASLQTWTDALLVLLTRVVQAPEAPMGTLAVIAPAEAAALARLGGVAAAANALADDDPCEPVASEPAGTIPRDRRGQGAEPDPLAAGTASGADAVDSTIVEAGFAETDGGQPTATTGGPSTGETDAVQATVHRVIELGSLGAADRPAIVTDGPAAWTHRRLHRHADHLAQALRERGIRRGCRVALVLPQGPALVVAMLAVAKAGGTGVCLDPRRPAAERGRLAADAWVVMILIAVGLQDVAADSVPPVMLLGAHGEVIDADGVSDVVDLAATGRAGLAPDDRRDARAGDAAFVVSMPAEDTGGAGAVPAARTATMRHRSVVALIDASRTVAGLGPGDRVLAIAAPGTARSLVEVLAPLRVGAALVFAPEGTDRDPGALARWLEASGATVLFAPPSTWQRLVDAGWTGQARLAAWVDGPEIAPTLAAALHTRCRAVWRLGGWAPQAPWVLWQAIGPGDEPALGRPVSGTAVRILDRQRRDCPPGVDGELWLAGAGLTFEGRIAAERTQDGAWWHPGTKARWRDDGMLLPAGPGRDGLHPPATRARPARPVVDSGSPDAAARVLAQAWARALQRADVALDDDFFALGGTPAQAHALLQTIEAATGRASSLAMLVRAPTPRAHAALSTRTGGGAPVPVRWRSASDPLSAEAVLPVIVLGQDTLAEAMAALLPGPWRGWVVDAPGGLQGSGVVTRSGVDGPVDALAEALLHAMPQGPVRLVGVGDAGARLAHEVSIHLRGSGRPVAALALVDPRPVASPAPTADRGFALGWLTRALRRPFTRPDEPPSVPPPAAGATGRGGVARLIRPSGGGHAGDPVTAEWTARLPGLQIGEAGGDAAAWRTTAGAQAVTRAICLFLEDAGS